MSTLIETSPTIANYAKALLAAQKNVKDPVKDKVNPHLKNRYASLAAVKSVAREALNGAGLVFEQWPVDGKEGTVSIVTRVIHAESGEWAATKVSIPVAKIDAQAFGSGLTYVSRYSLIAILGIAPDEDDDGNEAVQRGAAPDSRHAMATNVRHQESHQMSNARPAVRGYAPNGGGR